MAYTISGRPWNFEIVFIRREWAPGPRTALQAPMFAWITFQGIGDTHVYLAWTHRLIPMFSHQWGVERTEAKKIEVQSDTHMQ